MTVKRPAGAETKATTPPIKTAASTGPLVKNPGAKMA
jgi:hypothetical protein